MTLAMPRVDASEPGLAERAVADRPDLTVEGRTALIIPVNDLGDKVHRWRQRTDPVAPGVPAHITVLVPFLPLPRVSAVDLAWLGQYFAGVRLERRVAFDQVRSFPSVVWLSPSDPAPFIRITEGIHQHWPECPPYEGKFDEVIPHLTVAHGSDLEHLVRLDLADELPITGRIEAAHLFAWTQGRWSDRATFPLGE